MIATNAIYSLKIRKNFLPKERLHFIHFYLYKVSISMVIEY